MKTKKLALRVKYLQTNRHYCIRTQNALRFGSLPVNTLLIHDALSRLLVTEKGQQAFQQHILFLLEHCQCRLWSELARLHKIPYQIAIEKMCEVLYW